MKNFLPVLFVVFNLSLQAQLIDVITGLSAPLTVYQGGDYLYFEESNSNTISRFDYTSASPVAEEIASGLDFPTVVIPAGDKLYYGQNNFDTKKIAVADLDEIPLVFTDIVTDVEVTSMTLEETDLYVTSNTDGIISKIDLTASIPMAVEIASIPGAYYSLIIGDELFVTSYFDGEVLKINLNEANPTPVTVVSDLDGPIYLLNLENDLYILEYLENKISKINITDSNPVPEDVLTELAGPTSAAFVANGAFYDMYIVEHIDGKISKYSSTITNTEDLYAEKHMSITPNPVNDYIQLNGIEDTLHGEIFDFQGRKIKSVTIENNQEVYVSDLSAGMYFIKLNGYQNVRFMKQ